MSKRWGRGNFIGANATGKGIRKISQPRVQMEWVGHFEIGPEPSPVTSETITWDGELISGLEASAQPGDLVVVSMTANQDSSQTGTPEAGWTKEVDLFENGTLEDNQLEVYWKVLETGDSDNDLFISYSTSMYPQYSIQVFRGAHRTDPIEDTQTESASGSVNDPPAITKTHPSEWIYVTAGVSGNNAISSYYANDFTSSDLDGFITGHGNRFYRLGSGYSETLTNPSSLSGGSTYSGNAHNTVTMAIKNGNHIKKTVDMG